MTYNDQRYVHELEGDPIEINIRLAKECDARAILGLMQRVGQETDYLATGPEGLPYTVEEEKEILRTYAEAPNSVMLVAEVDEQLIGIASLAAMSHKGRTSHVAEVGISLIKEYWNYGVGSILLEELMHFAEQSDLKVLTLEVVTQNERAVNLYKKFAFKIVGELSQRLRVDYTFYDTYIMELLL